MLRIKMQKTNVILEVEHDFEQCATYLEKAVEAIRIIIWDQKKSEKLIHHTQGAVMNEPK